MKSRKDGRPLSLYLLLLNKNDESKCIFKLKALYYISVEIENYRTPKQAVQCFKYQNFFYRSDQCFIKRYCVGCGQSHLSEFCPCKSVPSSDFKSEPFCCICMERHTKNFKGCKNFPIKPMFKKSFVDITKTRKNSKLQS